MQVIQETRGNYQVNVYKLDVTPTMKAQALDFATRIIRSDNQYSRLLPQQVWASHNLQLQQRIEIQRTYVGKLGELVFLNLLTEKGKTVNVDGMFEIYQGQRNVDAFDFKTRANSTVDIKTGFRSIHSRLLVNEQQFHNSPKNFYVGVWLNGVDDTSQSAENKLIKLDSITKGIVFGYAEYGFLNREDRKGNFGEGPARYHPYNRLMGIDRLINMF